MKTSDLVGSSKIEINEKMDFIYNFSLDQNYKDFNYNEFNSNFNFDPMKIGLDIFWRIIILAIRSTLKLKSTYK